MKFSIKTLCASVALVATAGTAQAFSVGFWDADQGGGNGIPGPTTQTVGNPANNQINNLVDALAIIGFRDADATFTSSGLDYPQGGGADSASNSGLLKDFLGTDWASLSNNSGSLRTIDDTTVNNASIFEFTGFIELLAGSNAFSIASDDGFQLEVGGNVIASFEGTRAINGPSTVNYNSSGGIESFRLVFFEDQNVQVGLYGTLNGEVITHVAPVPLPAGLLLMGTALVGLGAVRRRAMKSA